MTGLTPDSPRLSEEAGGDVHGFPVAADPERALAIQHARAAARPALAALFLLDHRFGTILAGTGEPQIGAMRLIWWREALERLDASPAPAEPLLTTVAETLLPLGISGAELAAMEEGWMALLEGDPPDAELIARHGEERGARLFLLAGRILGEEAVSPDGLLADAGAGWALADLARRLRSPVGAAGARDQAVKRLEIIADRRWPRSLRPLGMLAMLARRDAQASSPERRGAPGRLLRMLRHRLTGR